MTKSIESAMYGLEGPVADALVDRTVGDSVFYVSLKDGTSLGFQPKDVMVRSRNRVRRYAGQTFRELGLINGAKVQVVGLNNPDKPDLVVVDIDQKPRFFRWLRSDI